MSFKVSLCINGTIHQGQAKVVIRKFKLSGMRIIFSNLPEIDFEVSSQIMQEEVPHLYIAYRNAYNELPVSSALSKIR